MKSVEMQKIVSVSIVNGAQVRLHNGYLKKGY